ncbi:hypothetical protein Pmani_011528 [Petrolisthes manimaculis]|uniref:Uncharacterized protein n=1 Tax=Petrolisthes manimaculis TaxID=1843537 RepID=A0AAE1Q0I5_9EUCA|nr:hypothetical protein Pmani_011528 [Petrolisthes manimaculis]
MTCGQRSEYVNEDDMWTERHQTSPPAVRLDSDKMQCANIFFILSIGFASAALAVGNPFTTRMKIISPDIPFQVSTSEGIISTKFEKGNWAAASVICSRIEIPHPQYQRAIIIDEQTAAELHTTDSDPITFNQNEEYIMIDDFSIEIIESKPMNTRPQMECTIAGIPTSQN